MTRSMWIKPGSLICSFTRRQTRLARLLTTQAEDDSFFTSLPAGGSIWKNGCRFLSFPASFQENFFLANLRPPQDLESSRPSKTVSGSQFRKNKPFKPTADDEACAKLWSVYIDEAQRYDEELLKGWKQDMEGMLLFSALYSASLTAFLIESYKTLQADPAQNTVDLLAQISQQLAAVSNGTIPPFQPIPAFIPPASAVICNILWFLSLALALMCSLLATLVQQWTRDFIHKTNMRPSPIRQSRALSFLYAGVRDFGMHSLVDAIPFLLHLSLFFFFTGLVCFLLPVNRPLTYIMACVLAIFLAIYVVLTCIPLLYLNAPYRTPLSATLWQVGNAMSSFLIRRHGLVRRNKTLINATLENSLHTTAERDWSSLIYTMKSLTDERELLPFIEGISDALCDIGKGFPRIRQKNTTLLLPLLETLDPKLNIISRISHFLEKSDYGPESSLRERGSVACSRALWSLAYMLLNRRTQRLRLHNEYIPHYRHVIQMAFRKIPQLNSPLYKYSTFSVIRLSWVFSLRNSVDMVEEILLRPGMAVAANVERQFALVSGQPQNIAGKLHASGYTSVGRYPTPHRQLTQVIARCRAYSPGYDLTPLLEEVIVSLKGDTAWQLMRAHVFLEYLLISQDLVLSGTLPHAFKEMCEAIYPDNELIIDSDDVGVLASHHVVPLLGLKRHLEDKKIMISEVTDIIMVQYMKLFCSIRRAFSDAKEASEGRCFIIWYFGQRGGEDTSGVQLEKRDLVRVGNCIMRSLWDDAVDLDFLFRAAWYCLTDRYIWFETDFALRLWQVLHIAPPTFRGSKKNIYPYFRNLLDQAILHGFTSSVDHSFHDHYHNSSYLPRELVPSRAQIELALLQEYLPDLNIPSTGSPPSYMQSCKGSLIIAIAVQWINLSQQCPPELFTASLSTTRVGHLTFNDVDETRQIAFARSVSNLIDALIAQDPEREHHLYVALDCVWGMFESVDRYTNLSGTRKWKWNWVTSKACAEILLDAITRYKESRVYQPPSRFEEGRVKLCVRCQEMMETQVSVVAASPAPDTLEANAHENIVHDASSRSVDQNQ